MDAQAIVELLEQVTNLLTQQNGLLKLQAVAQERQAERDERKTSALEDLARTQRISATGLETIAEAVERLTDSKGHVSVDIISY